MCECVHDSTPATTNSSAAAEARGMRVGRRGLFRGAAVGSALLGAGVLAGAANAQSVARQVAHGTATKPDTAIQNATFALALLGTKAGPPVAWDRAGISTALIVDGATYLIDCGRSSVTQYQLAGLSYARLAGIFVTHLHADHVSDYYNFFLHGGVTGQKDGDVVRSGLAVYGPGSAQGLPDAYGGERVPMLTPPTPGISAMTQSLHQAFAYSSNVFLRDAGLRDPRDLTDVHEIALPKVGSSSRNTAPDMAPFTVMEDDRVKVTATLVPHGPVYPAFGFRFDTDHGSVTFSGDTRRSENLIRLAQGSDVLVHEALRNPENSGLTDAILDHHRNSHVFVDEVGPIAQAANVEHLLLDHIEELGGNVIDPAVWTTEAQQGYGGKITVAQDLMTIDLT